MRVTVDQARCIGNGCCAANAPSVFRLDERGLVTVIDPTGGSLDEAALYAIAKDCPTAAVLLNDERGMQLYP